MKLMSFTWVFMVILTAGFGTARAAEYDVKGKSRLRYEDTQGYSGTTFQRSGFWSIRVRPSVDIKVDDHASIFIEPQFAKIMGRDYSYTQTSSSGSTAYNENFHMHQGYLKLRFSDEFQIKGGRLALDYANAIILGVADWGTFGRSFDGVMLGYKNDLVTVDLGHLKISATPNTIDADKELALLYTSWNFGEALKAFDIYGLYESNRASGANDHRHSVGTRAKAKFETFDIGAEYAMEKGSSAYITGDQTGTMIFAEVGRSFPAFAGNLRVGFEYNQANENWREWYPTTKSHLGRNDVVGRRNLTAIALRTKADLSEKLSVNLDYWQYSRSSTSATAFKTGDTTTVGTTAASSSQDLGNSIELSAKYQLSEKVEYGMGAAVFTQGDYLRTNFGDRTMTDFYAMANVNF